MVRGDAILRARAADSPHTCALLIGAISARSSRDLRAISARSRRDIGAISTQSRRDLGAISA